MRIVNFEEENFHIFWTTWGINFNENFQKDVNYNNVKMHKTKELQPLNKFKSAVLFSSEIHFIYAKNFQNISTTFYVLLINK